MSPTRWKWVVAAIGVITAGFFLYQSFQWSQIMTQEEEKWMGLWALAYQKLQRGEDAELAFEIIKLNEKIPIILVNDHYEITHYRNLGVENPDSVFLHKSLQVMRRLHPPITFQSIDGRRYHIYYGESRLKKWLQMFPWAVMGLVGMLFLAAYVAVKHLRRHEQERVWLGLAKEAAHQMGTPIMGLMGWLDYLRESGGHGVPPDVEAEMRKDVERLQKISERFSKIGAPPQKVQVDLRQIIDETVNYLQRRFRTVRIEVHHADDLPPIQGAPLLLEWALENLVRNAIDAMRGKGRIRIETALQDGWIVIDVIDEGGGIDPAHRSKIFDTGFTTKKRGMGLGLPLARRIIEQHHGGRLFIARTEKGRGSTFRIVLEAPKQK